MRLFFHFLALSRTFLILFVRHRDRNDEYVFTRKFPLLVCLFVAIRIEANETRIHTHSHTNLILLESFASTRISYIINWLNEIVIEYLIHKIRAFGFIFRSKDKICFKCIGFASVTFFTQSIRIEIDFGRQKRHKKTHSGQQSK